MFGTLATLLAGIFSYLVRNIRWKEIPVLAPLPPVIFNAIIVGFEVACLADNGTFAFGNLSLAGFIAGAVSVGIGELIVCYVLGVPLMMALRRTKISELMLA